MSVRFTLSAAISVVLLSACGGSEEAVVYHGDEMLSSGMTIAQTIDSRQRNLRDLGGAFKTINDQVRTGSPIMSEIQLAAAEVQDHSRNIGFWFPEGTGKSSGVETETLDAVWTDADGFAEIVARFEAASGELVAAAESENVETIVAAFRATGRTCSDCHDGYREEED